jgi:integrase
LILALPYNCARLEWSRVDLLRQIAWVPKLILIDLSDDAIALLKRRRVMHAIFCFTYADPKQNGKMRPIGSPKTAWNAAVKRAGIPHVRWHDLRMVRNWTQ